MDERADLVRWNGQARRLWVDDRKAIQFAIEECRTQRDHWLFYAREAARKVKKLEAMLADLPPAQR